MRMQGFEPQREHTHQRPPAVRMCLLSSTLVTSTAESQVHWGVVQVRAQDTPSVILAVAARGGASLQAAWAFLRMCELISARSATCILQ